MSSLFLVGSLLVISQTSWSAEPEEEEIAPTLVHEVVGTSPNGDQVAIRRSVFDPQGEDGACSYPTTPPLHPLGPLGMTDDEARRLVKKRHPLSVSLLLCTPENPDRPRAKTRCKEEIPIRDAAENLKQCTTMEEVENRLREARRTFSASAIDLDRPPTGLKPADDGFIIPDTVMLARGISVPVSLTLKQRRETGGDDVYLIRAFAEGYGASPTQVHRFAVHESERTEELRYFQHPLVSADNQWLYYYVRHPVDEDVGIPVAMPISRIAARVVHSRGFVQLNDGSYLDAITDFERSWQLDPKFGQAAYNLARAFVGRGDNETALQYLEKAIAEEDRFRLKAPKEEDLKPLRQDPRWKTIVGTDGADEDADEGQETPKKTRPK
ncbi:MAG: tetratricopeptide repeat protein [Proteobacteria bacterium]|nr:tetratricopeptide repeat protein [Pseudomonadota bacterium]